MTIHHLLIECQLGHPPLDKIKNEIKNASQTVTLATLFNPQPTDGRDRAMRVTRGVSSHPQGDLF